MNTDKYLKTVIRIALEEDIGKGDITSISVVAPGKRAEGVILARERGIVCGLKVVEMVFAEVDRKVKVKLFASDGDKVKAGDKVCHIEGPARSILAGERVALNYLCYMSGISSETYKYVCAVKGTKAKIYDTRKTMPGFRILEKYSVLKGGGKNQRIGLYDQVLIKDNHIKALPAHMRKNLAAVVEDVRKKIPKSVKIEIEVETLPQVRDVVRGKPDMILLDNMKGKRLSEAVKIIRNASRKLGAKIEIEASGGINMRNLKNIAKSGVDRISIGAITHSSPILDFSLEFSYK